ncbi:MAG TPA: pitrilysin family protein [Paracoccus sp. (in: a-proteobacteria)]|uniref:M16 family metallopeptidase n=1 Tax=uncultured Paracoccus sp. TaxID=189685 RepID=UPI0026335D3E|nr:pitrilysin family protein [uncultured Paracoccus sp.]HMQ40475.1 pitrilysin family protein [Paracoccus sp. (in: a-proteobacteria)]HMR34968.1 pitrilysin family protein [Paracoccus sp. (in: a-proteobacteria)]
MSFLRAIPFILASLIADPAAATEIQEVTSPSGIKAWLVEDHSIPFTALNLAFRGGASLDAPGKRGAINLMTHTLEEGAGEMDATAFAAATEDLGARITFDVSDDALVVSSQLLTENRDQAAALIGAALSDPLFAEDAVARVKGQVMSLVRSEENDPNAIARTALAKSIWGAHPYGSSINGTVDTLTPLGPQDMVEAKNRVIARDRVIVGAAGDITPEELGLLIDEILSGLPETGTVPLPDQASFSPDAATEVIDWDSPQTVVAFALPGPEMDDPDYFAAFVANRIFGGGGFSSRLMEEIREKRGLTYGVYTALVNGVYGPSWMGGMSSSNASVAEAVTLLRGELARMADGVSDKELADAKTYLTGEYPLRWDGNGKIAGILAGMQLIGLPIDYPEKRSAMIEAVTAEDVARVSAERLTDEHLHLVLVGRPEHFTP